MALLRLDVPGVVALRRLDPAGPLPGPRRHHPGRVRGGRRARGRQDDATPTCRSSRTVACPGAGACGGQFTANTMAMALEFLGLSPMGTASVAATDPRKDERRRRCRARWSWTCSAAACTPAPDRHARRVRERHRRRRRHRRLDQRRAAPAGASPARPACRSRSTTSTASAAARRCWPTCKPGGRFTAVDLGRAGGTGVVATAPGRRRASSTAAPLTVTGRTFAEEAARAARDAGAGGRPAARPTRSRPTGGLVILRGNLAPEGCVVKVAGHERAAASRPGARLRPRGGRHGGRHARRRSRPGDVVVIRYEGPRGGPGMREMLGRHRRARRRRARRERRAPHRRPLQRRDARPHGGPRRARGRVGGPDRARSRRATRSSSTSTTAASTSRSRRRCSRAARRAGAPPAPRYTSGVFAKYAALVSSAAEGAITRPGSDASTR